MPQPPRDAASRRPAEATGAVAGGLDSLRCDAANGLLHRGPDRVQIGQRGARILSLLLDRRASTVPHAELMEAGWPGYVVEESSLLVEIASLRDALGRLLGGGPWITATAREGYLLDSPDAGGGMRLPGRWQTPAIGVLPITADPLAEEGAAEALTRTVTATLALHAGLAITPAHVTTLIAGTHGERAAELDLRYLMQGSLQGTGAAMRASFTLSDIESGRVLWSDSFDAPAPLSEERQGRLAAEVVQALDILLVRGEEAAVGYPPTRNLQAWAHYIRGLGHAYWPRQDMLWGREINLALAEWQKALELDPDSADLLATIGAGHAVLAAYPAVNQPAAPASEAGRYLQAALDRDPDHPVALAFHALILSELDRFEVATEVARRAIRLAPLAPAVTAVAAVALCAVGLAEEAMRAVERTLAATPHFPSVYTPPLARAWRSAGRVDEAIRMLEALNEEPHKFDGRELILAYMQAGRHEDAVNVATQLLLLEPGFTVTGWLATQHRADPDAIARDAAALRAVGLPD